MKQNFWTKIKEVSIKDFLHFFLFLFALLPAYIYKRIRGNIWLICENEQEARDNGYWLYRYIRQSHPECDVVYAINPNSQDAGRVNKLGQVISYGTFKHWIYYLAAEVNISTQKGGKPNAAVCYFLEVYGFGKNIRVFLQHGIIMNDLPFCHYENAKFSLFMTSTTQEYKYVVENFHYTKGEVQLTGLCRFDDLHDGIGNPKMILVMPTWRGWISPPSNAKGYQQVADVKKTDYYDAWQSFMTSKEMIDILEEYDCQLYFYQHREMQKYKGLFESIHPRIKILDMETSDVHELLKEAGFLVTDYSSVAMDFAYMNKPLCYYQFDESRFRREHYEKGYFDYWTDGFGPVVKTYNQLIEVLRTYCEGTERKQQCDGAMNPLGHQYETRRTEFFDLKDDNNCHRNYEVICKLLDSSL